MTDFFLWNEEWVPDDKYVGKECSSISIYTRSPDFKCDGWAYTSFEECKTKCVNNEVPASCQSHPDFVIPPKGCAYAVWDDNPDHHPGWCQLANDNCTLAQKSTGIVWENSKEGKKTTKI